MTDDDEATPARGATLFAALGGYAPVFASIAQNQIEPGIRRFAAAAEGEDRGRPALYFFGSMDLFSSTQTLLFVLEHRIALEPAARPAARRELGVFPPPDFAAAKVTAENHLEITVAIDIEDGAAGLDAHLVRLNYFRGPATGIVPPQRQRGGAVAPGHHEIRVAIPVDV
jgi:hypothetical protein